MNTETVCDWVITHFQSGHRVTTNPPTRYHTTHIPCNHQVWYDNAQFADAVRTALCPWCGAETGVFAPYGVLNTAYGRVYPAADMGGPDASRAPASQWFTVRMRLAALAT